MKSEVQFELDIERMSIDELRAALRSAVKSFRIHGFFDQTADDPVGAWTPVPSTLNFGQAFLDVHGNPSLHACMSVACALEDLGSRVHLLEGADWRIGIEPIRKDDGRRGFAWFWRQAAWRTKIDDHRFISLRGGDGK